MAVISRNKNLFVISDEPNQENEAENNASDVVEEELNLFRLLRSYSLPNLFTTPLENLYATISDKFTQPTVSEPVVTFEDEECEDPIWHLSNPRDLETDKSEDQQAKSDPVYPLSGGRRLSDESNIFSYLESQRAYLENRVGCERLIRVYKLVSR